MSKARRAAATARKRTGRTLKNASRTPKNASRGAGDADASGIKPPAVPTVVLHAPERSGRALVNRERALQNVESRPVLARIVAAWLATRSHSGERVTLCDRRAKRSRHAIGRGSEAVRGVEQLTLGLWVARPVAEAHRGRGSVWS